MRSGASLIALLASLAASACQQTNLTSGASIDFVRGCWVQKDAPGGTIQAFLRLLPSEAGSDEQNYSGEIQEVTLGEAAQTRAGLSFARDGSSASWWILFGGYSSDQGEVTVPGSAHDSFKRTHHPARQSRQNEHRAIYESIYVSGGTLVVEAMNERLKVTRNLVETIFDGERDGCD